MQCPYCSSTTKVTNSRSTAKETRVWRRRKCRNCQRIWTTTETIDLSKSHKITGSDRHLEAFSRDKLFMSIKDSLQHRKSALEDANALTDTVLSRIILINQEVLLSSGVTAISYDVIRRFDKTASAVYKATHKN